MTKVAIVDYGLANIKSVVNAIDGFPVELVIATDGALLKDADKIVLPGVGHFDAGMKGLVQRGHAEALAEQVLEKKKPFLGICLGMQLIFEGSQEGDEPGLGWLPGRFQRFPNGNGLLKVPHMGWSDVEISAQGQLLSELKPPTTFYFVHSFYLPFDDITRNVTMATCDYGFDFSAAVEHENIFATQFHPEKSQLAGMKIIETFLERI